MLLQRFINWIVTFIFNRFKPTIKFAKKFPEAQDPTRREDESIGFDLYTPKRLEFQPGERKLIDTGIIFEFPSYMGMFLWDKSSVALDKNLSVCGGVIDPGYRGSIGVLLQNCAEKKITIPKGGALCQAIFHLTLRPTFNNVDELDLTDSLRGTRGFGKTEWMCDYPLK